MNPGLDVTQVNTIPEGIILINYQKLDEVSWPISFLVNVLKAFDLQRLSNSKISSNIPIIGAYPIAVLRGMAGPASDGVLKLPQGKLPMIGVEQMDTSPENMFLGVGQSQRYLVQPAFLDILKSIPEKERMFSQSVIDVLESAVATHGSEKVSLIAHKVMKHTGFQISCWSDDWNVTRLIQKACESAMIELYRSIKAFGVQAQDYHLEPNLYNWDFGETLFGFEIQVPCLLMNMNYLIDTRTVLVKEFNIGGIELPTLPSDGHFRISPFGMPPETHPEEVFVVPQKEEP